MISRCIFAAVCAAYSLAAGSAALAAPPAAGVEQTLQIKSFTANVSGPVPLGTQILVTLVGSPGGKAIFGIPNAIDHAPMTESAPGVYIGRYTVAAGHDVEGDRIVGRLTLPGGLRSPMLCAPNPISIDTTRPKLVEQFPADGDFVTCARPVMYCGFDDGAGTGIDPKSVRVQIDGRDVAADAQIGPTGLCYRPRESLADGPHMFYIAAADRAGNRVWAVSHFTIAAQQAGQGAVTVTRVGDGPLLAGDVLTVDAVAAPGGRADFSLPPLVNDMPLAEVEPGRYTGKFAARAGDTDEAAPVIVRFTPRGGRTFSATLDRPIAIDAGRPARPLVRVPNESVSFQGDIEIAGTADAGDRVICTVSYDSRSDGGVMPFTGNALTATARVDKTGKWKIGPLNLNLALLYADRRDTSMTVTAVTVDAAGDMSDPMTVPVDYAP